jgi:outer membrane receptor protein involved in Fe transport
MLFRRYTPPIAVTLAVLICSVPAWAQSQDGRITGVVRDTTGGTVPGVTVTATNQTNNTSASATTANDGTYTIRVAPGSYSVVATLPGFRRVTRVVEVASGGSAQFDVVLEAQLTEEVTVTATKREMELFEVPFSIASPTEEVLRTRGVEDVEGIAANVGGFTVQNLGPGQSQVAMRGVSAGQIVRDQPGVKEQVGTYLDESVVSLSLFTPDIDLFDINRVEVLRGPQGTLFGAGSLTGTVRYITNQPIMGVTQAFGEFGGSFVQGGNMGGNAKFGFNVPIGETAAARVAAYYTRIPGYIDAVQPHQSR